MECIEQLAGTEKFSKKSKKRLEEQQMCLKRKSWSFGEVRKEKGRLRIQMVGLGDVGQNVAIGLTLLGGDQIESIGLYDLNRAQLSRMELELGQFSTPPGGKRLPVIQIVSEAQLFDCDVFLFCATKVVPAIGSEASDVRMAQYEANRKIVSIYGKMASERAYQGLFLVISDPVDLLCMEVLRSGITLHPEQIRGCGLGVMNARARYYAGKASKFSGYLKEGRAFGPHGQDLVIANSIDNYDDERSKALTKLAIEANLRMRELGFKPYVAPAISSAAISLLLTLRGEWHYSSNFLNGVYMGSKNRTTLGVEFESLPLPDTLFQRIQKAYDGLEMIR